MKLRTNMYVRTKWGIVKFLGYCQPDLRSGKIEEFYYKEDDISRTVGLIEDIIKVSHNIIDLIEVGDYVNGCKVHKIANCITIILDNEENISWVNPNDIKSIVTKEQFKANEYVIGE